MMRERERERERETDRQREREKESEEEKGVTRTQAKLSELQINEKRLNKISNEERVDRGGAPDLDRSERSSCQLS